MLCTLLLPDGCLTKFNVAIYQQLIVNLDGCIVQTSYFDTNNGFTVIGGITLMVYFFVAIVMLQCDQHKRSATVYLLFRSTFEFLIVP